MQFLYINVIYLMLIPSIILMILIIKKKNSFEKYFTEETLNKLSISNNYFSNKARNTTLFISLLFMIFALARPVTNEKIHDTKQQLNAIVIAIDVSKSMMANDIYPNRLEFAKKKLLDIIELSKTNALGVILFAKSSFILSPITQDFSSLKILIKNLDTGINFDNGTDIYSTLETTNKLLENYTAKNLILLSDGGDKNEFKEEIEFANKRNITVFTIGTATNEGSAIKLDDGNYLVDTKGNIVNVDLNENIKKLSLETSGGYINYSLDSNDISEILKEINSKSEKQEFKEKRFKTYTELFIYPLSLGLFFLLIAFSSLPSFKSKNKINIFMLFTIFYFLNNTDIKASIFDFKTIDKADSAYKSENYKKAIEQYSSLEQKEQTKYNLANSLYKDKKYEEAIKKYKDIKSDDKYFNFKRLHNLGNSYVNTGNLEKAKSSYKKALKIKNDKQTKENLELVEKEIEKKKQNEQNKDSEKKDSKDNKKETKKDESKKENRNKKEDEEKQKDKKTYNQNEISDLEEEKWIKQLENQKTNSLLKKMNSIKKENDLENPW